MEHIILVKYKSWVGEREVLKEEIEDLFEKALDIEGVRRVRVLNACTTGPKRYDVMIHMTMEKESLALFDRSPIHAKWKEEYGNLIEDKVIFDGASALFF